MFVPRPLLLSTEPASGYVLDLLIILLAAAAVSILARRIRLPSIPGYLLVGAAVGGSMLGLINSDDNVRQITDLAIVLLMFTIGLHLDTSTIRSGMVSMLAVGAVSTLAVALALWPVGMAFGLHPAAALAVGLGMSMSSTAVVLGLLQQRREVQRVHGRLAIGISLMQDLISIAALALLPALAAWAGTRGPDIAVEVAGAVGGAVAAAEPPELPSALRRLVSGVIAIAAIAALVAFGRWIMPRFLREASRGSNTEALLVVSATAALAAAVITSYVGIGPALGAFLAGFLLSATPFRHQLAGQLSPMRDLFMAVFFTAVGIKVNVGVALELWWIVGLGVVLLVSLKATIIALTTWAGGGTANIAVLTGCLLAQGGEFSLVILGTAAADHGLLDDRAMSVLVAIVVASLILTTPLYELARRLQPRMARVPPARWITHKHLHEPVAGVATPGGGPSGDPFRDEPLPYPHRPVIIAGFGVVGRNLAEHFAAAGIPYIVIELNPATVIKQQKLGRKFVFGDVGNPDVLESAGVHSAEAVILTVPDDEAVLRACRVIRQMSPSVFIAARTSYLSRAIAATELGADYVTIEEVVTAQDMAKQVMERLAKRLLTSLDGGK